MKKLLFSLLLISACVPTEKYVSLASSSTEKSTMIEVPTVVTQLEFTFKQKKLQIKETTATVKIEGSGVMISPNGHILTCAHLFNNGPFSVINVKLNDGITIPATLLYRDDAKDLALIKIAGTHPYARLAHSLPVVGQEVLVVGNPLGLEFSVSHGIVSQLNRDLGEGFTFTQVDAPINHGNSGGPLFNLSGELIGINARIIPNNDGLGFAISLETITDFLTLFRGIKE